MNSVLEKYIEICGKSSDMASLILTLSRSAEAVQISTDYEIFCKEIAEALKLTGQIQYEISEEAWNLVEVLELILQQNDGRKQT